MPIDDLVDIRAAVQAAAASVTTQVSVLVADVPVAIGPGEEYRFDVTVSNTAAGAIRLVDVVYHLAASPSTRAQLKVPPSPPARAVNDPTAPVLAPGSFVSSYFLFPTDSTLDVGDVDTVAGLKGKALDLGNASITCHPHCNPDLDYVFPKGSAGPLGVRNFTVT